MRTPLIWFLAVVVISCGKPPSPSLPKQTVFEITGSKTQRIAGVTKILSAKVTLPSVVEDAFFLEEQTGDGQLGPSDFSSFCPVITAAEEVVCG